MSDTEGAVLIGLGHAVEVTDADARAEAPKKKVESKAPPASKAPETAPTKVDEDRAALIADALDLIEGEHTVEAVADITGLADVTAEEIAAVTEAKAAAE